MGLAEFRFSCDAEFPPMFGLGMCSATLPGWVMIDKFEIVLQPSTTVLAPDMMLSPAAEEIGPGKRISPEITGKESTDRFD